MRIFKTNKIPIKIKNRRTWMKLENWAVELDNGEVLYGLRSEEDAFKALEQNIVT